MSTLARAPIDLSGGSALCCALRTESTPKSEAEVVRKPTRALGLGVSGSEFGVGVDFGGLEPIGPQSARSARATPRSNFSARVRARHTESRPKQSMKRPLSGGCSNTPLLPPAVGTPTGGPPESSLGAETPDVGHRSTRSRRLLSRGARKCVVSPRALGRRAGFPARILARKPRLKIPSRSAESTRNGGKRSTGTMLQRRVLGARHLVL